jgi:hypothetical protein
MMSVLIQFMGSLAVNTCSHHINSSHGYPGVGQDHRWMSRAGVGAVGGCTAYTLSYSTGVQLQQP